MTRLTRRTFAVAAGAALATGGLTGSAAAEAPGTGSPSAAGGPPGSGGGNGGGRPGGGAGLRELRGMWVASVANTNWPSAPGLSPAEQRQELLDLLDLAVERRLNTVMLQ